MACSLRFKCVNALCTCTIAEVQTKLTCMNTDFYPVTCQFAIFMIAAQAINTLVIYLNSRYLLRLFNVELAGDGKQMKTDAGRPC